MKKWIFGFACLLLAALIGTREWLSLKEIESTKIQLQASLLSQLELADDLKRLEEIQRSGRVYERFLEPVFIRTQKLLYPPMREQSFREWEKKVHQIIDDKSYEITLSLEAKVDDNLEKLKEGATPGIERLLQMLEATKKLESTEKLQQVVNNEIVAIKEYAREEDQKMVTSLAMTGKQKLSELRSRIAKMAELELLEYLASGAFYMDAQKPVLDAVSEIQQPKLRQSVSEEYFKQLRRTLQRRTQSLARVRNQKPKVEEEIQEEDNSISDLLRSEFEREKEREISLRKFTPNPSPSAPLTLN